jgi:glycerophosphoryl diester phosphodiesterase
VSAAAGPWPYPFWIAHRGAGRLAPENTLAAFRAGAAHGYLAFECDVKLSADGVPFLLHDDTLERTTDGRGRASEMGWGALSRLDAGSWHGRQYAGEPLPTLQALATWLLANGLHLDLEIKPTPGDELETGRVVARTAAALWQGQAVPPLLSSFRPEALVGAREAAPALPRALLLDSLWPGWFERASALGCVAVIPRHTLIDAELVARVRDAGLRLLTYTVNDADEAARLQALGLDGLVTDAVDRFAPAR